ncbi:hypothetical protein GGI20_004321 [Coemansia sp. BCRC 34301]|nr:hypothetical protein GGI20_004321 [Coemansia sp. BCRC 34301]
MACVICFNPLSDSANELGSSSSANDGAPIAALSCGHVFHLPCITLWQKRGTGDSCPFCDSRHLGLVLVLHIEHQNGHVLNKVNGSVETANDKADEGDSGCLPYKALLNSAALHAANCRDLEKENTVLRMEMDLKDRQLHDEELATRDLYKQMAALEHNLKKVKQILGMFVSLDDDSESDDGLDIYDKGLVDMGA